MAGICDQKLSEQSGVTFGRNFQTNFQTHKKELTGGSVLVEANIEVASVIDTIVTGMEANPNIIRVHRFVFFSAHATSLFYLIMMVVRKFGTLRILI